MKNLGALLVLSLAACVPAPIRPQPTKPELEAQAHLAQKRAALRRAELEREAAERAQADAKRKEAEARAPQTGKVNLPPSIVAQALDPKPEPQPVTQIPLEPSGTEQPAASVEPLPSVAAQRLEPKPELQPAEPAPIEAPQIAAVQPRPAKRADAAAFAWQLSDDLRQLHAQAEVQTLYNERGWMVSLGAETFFEPGEAQLRTDADQALDTLARLLRHYAGRGILMEGPDAARAQAVKRALTERGIPEEAIAAQGTGERIEFLVPQ